MPARIDRNTFNPKFFIKYFTSQLILACGVVAVSTFNYAFDQQGFNSTQAMNAFDKAFGEYSPEEDAYVLQTYYLSLLSSELGVYKRISDRYVDRSTDSLVYIGFAAGAWIGSSISSHYGRRMTIFCMSLWALVTATILVTSGVSENKWQILVGRVLNYIYIGMELSSVPVYQSEVVPAPIRGLMVGSYQVSLGIGGLIINGICRGTSTIQNNNAWMIPYGLYYVTPSFVACAIWFIPESPRWLLMKERDEEALRNLKLLRGEGNEIAAEAELELIRQSLREEMDEGSWADLFKGHNRRRTGIVCGVAFFFQATGQVFSGHYGAIFVKSLGTVNPWNITVSQSAINTVTSFCGILVIDRVGRRPLWMAGAFFCGVALMIMGGLGVPQPISYPYSQGIVAMMLIFQLTYVATIGPLYYTIQSETPASRLRDKTVRLGATVNIVTIFVVSFTLPYLLDPPYANLGGQVGFIYGSICFLALVWGYFFLPELKNRSLEELEELFAAKVPLRKFGQYQARSEGVGVAMSRLERMDDQDDIVSKLHVTQDDDLKGGMKVDVRD